MAVFLSQHGKSASKDVDPNRGLTEEGAREVQRVALSLKKAAIQTVSIQHSGKDRARQTAELFGAVLEPPNGVLDCEGINPLDDVTVFARTLDTGSNQMYVGHLPFMERLVSCLILGEPEKPVVRFQNGGVVCMDYDDDFTCWIIKWMLMPNPH